MRAESYLNSKLVLLFIQVIFLLVSLLCILFNIILKVMRVENKIFIIFFSSQKKKFKKRFKEKKRKKKDLYHLCFISYQNSDT